MKVGEALRSGSKIKRVKPKEEKTESAARTVSETETVSAAKLLSETKTGSALELGEAGCGNKRGGQRLLTGVENIKISAKSPVKHKKNDLGLETTVAKDIHALENEYSNRKKFPIPLSRIIMMAGELGGYKYGRFGLLSYLTHIMEKDYKTYCHLLSKCIGSMDRVSLSELGLTDGNKKVRLEIVGLGESLEEKAKDATPIIEAETNKKDTSLMRDTSTLQENISLMGDKNKEEKVIEAEFVTVGGDTVSDCKEDTDTNS